MSSILDALRKLENAETPRARDGVAVERTRRGVALALAAVVVAFAAGAGAAFWLRGGGAATAPRPVETAAIHSVGPAKAPEPVPAAEPTPPAPPAPAAVPEPARTVPAPAPAEPAVRNGLPLAAPAVPPSASPDAELPRIRVMDAPPAPMRRAEPPTSPREAGPETALSAPAPTIEPRARPSEEAPPPVPNDLEVLQRPPAGAPAIQVNFLVYSRSPGRRTVALTIGSGGMVTMREGDASDEVEVVRILPDRVHVRHAGQLFAVRAIQ